MLFIKPREIERGNNRLTRAGCRDDEIFKTAMNASLYGKLFEDFSLVRKRRNVKMKWARFSATAFRFFERIV